MKIIAICGRAQAGKSTLASYFEVILKGEGRRVVRAPFAGPLKKLAVELGWNGRKDEKGRKFLQLLGTDLMREGVDQDYWVKKWLEFVNYESPDFVICDDMRFPNEFATVLQCKEYLTLRVDRPSPLWTLLQPKHESEKHFKTFETDRIVKNNGTRQSLYWDAFNALAHRGWLK